MTSWRGEFTDDFFAEPAPDPARFGLSSEDDGAQDDPLLSDRSWAVSSYQPDVDALDSGTDPHRDLCGRGVPGQVHRTHIAGHRRAARSAGDRIPEPPWRLPRGEFGYAGQPEAFARKLRDVVNEHN